MESYADPLADIRIWRVVALLVLLFAAALLWRRVPLGSMLRSGLLWALIFGGVVLGYGVWDAARLERAMTVIEPGPGGALALERQRDGHFHALAEVNGVPVEFLVDTGASALVLSRRDAARVGLDPESLRYVSPAMTANGRIFSAPARLDRFALGPFEDRDVPAMVNGGALDVSLLGMDYLDRFARVSIEGDRLLLER